MALQQICNIANMSYMRRVDEVSSAKFQFNHDMLVGCSNLTNPFALAAPPFENPAVNLPKLQAAGGALIAPMKPVQIDFEHGTTTLAFKYQTGVVVAVDSRATGGQYIASQSMKKIVEINKHMLSTMAGGAADCVYWDRVLTKKCRMHELHNKCIISVAAASKQMANIAYSFKNTGLSMGLMLAGYDKGGPQLFYIDSTGSRCTNNIFSVGSGSVYAIGVLDTAYRYDMTYDEAIDLGQRAIYHATRKDSYSGGIVRVYHIDESGWKNVSEVDCMDLYYLYEELPKEKIQEKPKDDDKVEQRPEIKDEQKD